MQIAFCLFKYFPHGGLQRHMMKLARECLHRGHRVRVYVLHWNAPELREDRFLSWQTASRRQGWRLVLTPVLRTSVLR